MRGVPQGAPSSRVLFNMYVDLLATDIVAPYSSRCGDSAVIMLADDVLLPVIEPATGTPEHRGELAH